MAARGLPPPLGAEIPNDNPELFGGATFWPPTPCAAPRAWREPRVEMLHYRGAQGVANQPDAVTRQAVLASQVKARSAGPAECPAPTLEVDSSPELPTSCEVEPKALEVTPVERPAPTLAVDSPPELPTSCELEPKEPEAPPADAPATEGRAEDDTRAKPVAAPRLIQVQSQVVQRDAALAQGASPSDFDRFVKSLVQVAMGRGATRAAAELKKFLETEELRGHELGEASRSILIERGFCFDDDGTLRPTSALEAVLSSWRRALSGQEHDLDAAGDETLDHWASSLLGAWLACEKESLPTLRRALRKSGVLAFGMRAA